MQVTFEIPVDYESTSDPNVAKKWLEDLPDLFAADFEAAVKYSDEKIEHAKKEAKNEELTKKERIAFQQIANATALGHPSHCMITHLSVAWSENSSKVIIVDSKEMLNIVLDFLTTTQKTQIWHNYSYDGRLIRYFTGKDVINMQDTQIFAKTLLNHVEIFKANTRLKDLMGEYYGDWGIDSDYFHVSQQYEPKVLKYAATDSCATYKLWDLLCDFIKQNS